MGVKLSETIKEADNKLLFWILYFVSLFSFLQLIICIIFFIKYRKKVGPIGPRGFMGERGDKGDVGSCGDEENKPCRQKTLMLLIEKNFIESLGRELNTDELEVLYLFVYDNKSLDDAKRETNYKLNLALTTINDLNNFNNILISEIEIRLEENRNNFNSQSEIIKQVLQKMENYITEKNKFSTITHTS
jgi:hypothetical protein